MHLKIHAYCYHSIMCLLVTEFMVTDTRTRLDHFLSNLCCAGSILVVEKVLLELVPIGDIEH